MTFLLQKLAEFPECRLTDIGYEYRGQVSQTQSGATCNPWSLVKGAPSAGKGVFAEDTNYCRNPDKKSGGPWCYTDADTWDYCSIPFCKRKFI